MSKSISFFHLFYLLVSFCFCGNIQSQFMHCMLFMQFSPWKIQEESLFFFSLSPHDFINLASLSAQLRGVMESSLPTAPTLGQQHPLGTLPAWSWSEHPHSHIFSLSDRKNKTEVRSCCPFVLGVLTSDAGNNNALFTHVWYPQELVFVAGEAAVHLLQGLSGDCAEPPEKISQAHA